MPKRDDVVTDDDVWRQKRNARSESTAMAPAAAAAALAVAPAATVSGAVVTTIGVGRSAWMRDESDALMQHYFVAPVVDAA
jgi:hypothetical protein